MSSTVRIAAVVLLCGACGASVELKSDADGDGVPFSQDCDDADPTVFRTAIVFRDADGDGRSAGNPERMCIGKQPPAGWSLMSLGLDCDDHDRSRWQNLTRYVDADGDGVGAGEAVSVCAGDSAPGYATVGGDCAPDDASAWQSLAYGYRDADGDGYTVAAAGTICAGAALPAGYLTQASGNDCDDGDRTVFMSLTGYVDGDGDGFGAGGAIALCTSGALPQGYAAVGGDCAPADPAAWQELAYAYRDQDGDGFTVPESGQLCTGASLPAGYLTAPTAPDCNDQDGSVHQAWNVYADSDGDHVGAGSLVTLCAGGSLPAGYSLRGDDCAPDDAAAWQQLAYQYRDQDRDTFTVPETGTICSGAQLPATYLTTASGNDCDDGSPDRWQMITVYDDADGDGHGAGTGTALCLGNAIPAGTSRDATDCAAADATRWQSLAYGYVDRDGDGATVPEAGFRCSGAALDPPYYAQAHGHDCDDANPDLFRWVLLYPDADGDGVGAEPRQIMCLGATLPASGYSRLGYDVDDMNASVQDDEEEEDLLTLLHD